MSSVDNAGTPDVVLSSGYDPAGNRKSLSATIAGTPDFLNTYSYDALSRLDTIDQQGQTGGNAVATKSIYFNLDAIGDITEIDRANSVSGGPNQSGPGLQRARLQHERPAQGHRPRVHGLVARQPDLHLRRDPRPPRISVRLSVELEGVPAPGVA